MGTSTMVGQANGIRPPVASPPVLAWMDLEMTGLDPGRHVIVEIATLVTDDDLALVAEGPDLVVHADDGQLAAMDDVVRQMHTRSGLLADVQSSTLSLADAGRQTLDFLRAHVPEARTVPLCGNSIGTDRRFLAAQLPEIEDWLHYRSVDVSTVKELCRRWYPEALAGAPGKKTTHRALDDIRESVAELAYYRSAIFRAPSAPPTNSPPPTGSPPTTSSPSSASTPPSTPRTTAPEGEP
jgi:oligoribonuclease